MPDLPTPPPSLAPPQQRRQPPSSWPLPWWQRLALWLALGAALAGALTAVFSDAPPAERYDRCLAEEFGFSSCGPD